MSKICRHQTYFIIPPRSAEEVEILIVRADVVNVLVCKDCEGIWRLTDPDEFKQVYQEILSKYQSDTALVLFPQLKQAFYDYLLKVKST